MARALVVGTLLVGRSTFELFGRFEGVVSDTGVRFDHAVTAMAGLVGIPLHNARCDA